MISLRSTCSSVNLMRKMPISLGLFVRATVAGVPPRASTHCLIADISVLSLRLESGAVAIFLGLENKRGGFKILLLLKIFDNLEITLVALQTCESFLPPHIDNFLAVINDK